MDKNIKVIFIFALLLIVPLVSAVKPIQTPVFDVGLTPVIPIYEVLKKDSNYTVAVHVFNTSNGVLLTNATVNCTAHVFNQVGQEEYEANMDYVEAENDFKLFITGENFSTVGEYNVLVRCFDDERGGVVDEEFEVTNTGTILTEAESIIYGFIILILVLGLGGLMFLSIRLPFSNTKNVNGDEVQVNNLRVWKIAAIAFTYVITMWLFALLNNIASSYLILVGLTTFFKWAYIILLSLTFPVVILSIVLGFIAAIRSMKLEKQHIRFGND